MNYLIGVLVLVSIVFAYLFFLLFKRTADIEKQLKVLKERLSSDSSDK